MARPVKAITVVNNGKMRQMARHDTGSIRAMLDDDETKRIAAAIFERVTAGRILRDGTIGAHAPHDASASLEAARAFAERLKLMDRRSQTDRRVAPYGQWVGVERRVAHRRLAA
jgi:hypothetical protein